MADKHAQRAYRAERDRLTRRAQQELERVLEEGQRLQQRLAGGEPTLGDDRRLAAGALELTNLIGRLEAHRELEYLLADSEEKSDG